MHHCTIEAIQRQVVLLNGTRNNNFCHRATSAGYPMFTEFVSLPQPQAGGWSKQPVSVEPLRTYTQMTAAIALSAQYQAGRQRHDVRSSDAAKAAAGQNGRNRRLDTTAYIRPGAVGLGAASPQGSSSPRRAQRQPHRARSERPLCHPRTCSPPHRT